MDKELKSKWVAALRSGNYKQATNTLRSDEGAFCCLGVLLDISNKGEWAAEGLYVVEWGYDGDPLVSCEGDLDSLRKDFDISLETEKTLIDMNDNHGKDFGAIAEYVESAL